MTFKDHAGTTPVFWDFVHKTPRRGFHISCLRYWVPKLVFDMCWVCEADNSGRTLSAMTSFPSCPHRSSKSHRNHGIFSQRQTQTLSRPLLTVSSECPYVTNIRPYSHWERANVTQRFRNESEPFAVPLVIVITHTASLGGILCALSQVFMAIPLFIQAAWSGSSSPKAPASYRTSVK